MYVTGFADEIDPELATQIQGLQEEGIAHIELRKVWSRHVVDLSNDQLQLVKRDLDAHSLKVSCLGSDIGKIGITESFEPHVARFLRAIEIARFFETDYMRIFSFFIPEGESPEVYRDEVLRRLRVLVKHAEDAGITLLHENEKAIYGDTGERCLDIFQYCPSPNLRAAFDPANFVQCRVRPVSEAYSLIKDYVDYVHIKDAHWGTGEVVAAGQGDGDILILMNLLRERGYDGFLSIEHHLRPTGVLAGTSGAQRFHIAAKALKNVLGETGIAWR